MNSGRLKARVEKIELTTNPPEQRQMTVRLFDGETTEGALRRSGVWYPVALLPKTCDTAEEWLGRHAPKVTT
jgi:hypothetical protein